jgi:hypothetical protein
MDGAGAGSTVPPHRTGRAVWFFHVSNGINFSIQQPELVERESSRASGPRRGRTSTLTVFGGMKRF